MPLVEFVNVGRDKVTWQAALASTLSEHLENELKRKGALMSVNMGYGVDFSDECDVEGQQAGFIILGSGRVVGGWRVVSPQEKT